MNKIFYDLSNKKGMFSFLFVLIFPLFLGAQVTDAEVLNIIQNESEQMIVSENSRLMQDDFLYHAEMLADKLLTLNPESSNYNYRKGYVLLNLKKDYEAAIPFFEKAILSTDQNFDAYSAKEKSAPIDAFFHLATCYHLNIEIDKATALYSKFIAESRPQSTLIKASKLRLIQCDNAKSAIANPVDVNLLNLGDKINTSNSEYAPVISLDGTSLYFTSRKPWENGESDAFKNIRTNQLPDDVYTSFIEENSTWSTPTRLDFCSAELNEATVSVSTDERRLYVYQDNTGNGDIYYSDFYASKFNDIKILEDQNVNTENWETHLFVNKDRTKMFFSSDRPGGFGGKDIYYCTKESGDSWSTPVNLGPSINSVNDEDSPFLSIDNKRLYFSSNGEKSIGGFDILTSEFDENNTWSDAKNLGYPFNSTNDDIFYTTTIDGLRGFMTSSRKDGFGDMDIYEIQNDFLGVKSLAVFKGNITTSDKSPIPDDFVVAIKLTCKDCDEEDKNTTIYPRLRDGLFLTGLKSCKTYIVSYFNATDNVSMYDETFATECDKDYQEITRNFILDVANKTLKLIEKEKEITPVVVSTYKNLEFMHYFDYNKNKIDIQKGDLKNFIKEIESQLKEGRTQITVKVYSSASQVPTKAFASNQQLAEIRAENLKYDVLNYFESKPEYKGKVNAVIVTAIVDGPEYVKDKDNKKKYSPYQFVGLKTE
jgi:tetratricopeptide (TPR) repeat protein